MSIQSDTLVEVERKGVLTSIPFRELLVGDSYTISGDRWFVETKLEHFRSLEPGTAFRCRGRWYLKMKTGNIVHRLVGNLPFGVVDMDKPELIIGDHMVGRIMLTRI